MGVFHKHLTYCFPLVKQTDGGFRLNWFNDTLKKMRDRLTMVSDIYNITKDPETLVLLKSLRVEYRREICETKKQACRDYIMRSDNLVKAGWNLIKFGKNCSRRRPSPTAGHTSGDFNNYFATIAEEILDELSESPMSANILLAKQPFNPHTFFLTPVTESEVAAAISSLKNSNSFDLFGLNSKILKGAAH